MAASFFAEWDGVTHASTNNLPNAGHTAVFSNKQKFVSKVLPAVHMMNRWHPGRIKSFVGGGSGFFLDRILEEILLTGGDQRFITIHPRASVVTLDDMATERGGVGAGGSTKHIASTMQGSGAAVSRKIMRGADVKLAGDYSELDIMTKYHGYFPETVLEELLKPETVWLHEGSQGFSLGINHGSHYPNCTSRECGVARELSDMGVAPRHLGEVVGVMRPYPIRVGNVVEDGKEKGNSGGCYEDQREISWAEVREACGGPDSIGAGELTTVTKRLRRVFTYSPTQVRRACMINGVTGIFLNFANYIDWEIADSGGSSPLSGLSKKVADFVSQVEYDTGVPVKWLGTGPRSTDVLKIKGRFA